jgi:serine/threonine-protein kinase
MSAPSCADRNLIFGLLALQMDFISHEQLVDAMNGWMLDKQTPLGEILWRRGVLAEDERDVLEKALEKHLRRHGDKTQMSLAALRIESSVRQDLSRLDDRDLRESLSLLIPPLPDDESLRTCSGITDECPAGPAAAGPARILSHTGRFRRLWRHAQGGLGEVFVALDGELNREVALKEIQDRFADDTDRRRRFLREAEVTGSLEHPGIVPVYGLGAYPDGRPYYAMRFIKGDSMQEAIKRLHAPQAQGLQPLGLHSLAFRELLGRFVMVCNAVAYAHSRGVIHRDLKPANVMLGEFGETLLVDWGLAKVLAPHPPTVPPHPPAPSPTKGRGGERQGETGSNVACLSPPLPPWESGPGGEGKIAEGEGSDTVVTEMGQVIGTAGYMSPEQAAGRPDQVGPSSDIFSLGATLYCLLTGHAPYTGPEALIHAAMGEWVPARQRKGSTPAALEAVCARAMAAKPEERYGTAKALAEDVERFLADEPVSAYRQPLAERLGRTIKRHSSVAAALAVGLLTATAALAVGLAAVNVEKNRTLSALEQSRESEESASEQRQLALKTVRWVVDDVHKRLKDRPAQKELRKAILARTLEGLKEVADAADTRSQVDHATIWVHFELGDIFLEIEEGGTAQAKKQFETAHDLAMRAVEKDPGRSEAQRDLYVSYIRLGRLQMRLGDSKAALAAFQQGLKVSERLAEADPASAKAQRDVAIIYDDLGSVQMRLGDSKAAQASYQQALAVNERLARADPCDTQIQRALALSYDNLGDVHMRLGDHKSALAWYQQSLRLCERLARADAGSVQAQRDLSSSYTRLGDMHLELGELKAALDFYQQGLEMDKRLAQADPTSAEIQRDLAVSYEKLGDVQMKQGDSKAALASYKRSLELSERLARADPLNAEAQSDLASSYSTLGDVQMQLADGKAALAYYQKSLAVRERLAMADPNSAEAQGELAESHDNLGNAQLRLGDSQAARTSYLRSQELRERLVRADPSSAEAQRDLMVSLRNLGYLEQRAGAFSKAIDWYAKAMDLPKRFGKADFFKKDIVDLENRLRVCRAAAEAVADPAAALKQPEELRLNVLLVVTAGLAWQKKADRAMAAADLLAANAKRADDLYEAGSACAVCVPLAGSAEARAKRAARAVLLLRQAVDSGFKDIVRMKQDANLDALRGRDDFKKLLAALEAVARPKTKKSKIP